MKMNWQTDAQLLLMVQKIILDSLPLSAIFAYIIMELAIIIAGRMLIFVDMTRVQIKEEKIPKQIAWYVANLTILAMYGVFIISALMIALHRGLFGLAPTACLLLSIAAYFRFLFILERKL